MTYEEAKVATRNGAVAAVISACLTLAVWLFSAVTNAQDSFFSIFNDPLILGDVILLFCLAFAISRHSRAAAMFLFVYFVGSKIIIGIEVGRVTGVVMSLVFLYFYGKAIQGAFVYHKLAPENDDAYSPPKKSHGIFTGVIAALFIALMGFGLFIQSGAVPDTKVLAGDAVAEWQKKELAEIGVFNEREELLYMYSYGLSSLKAGGSLLTNFRVVSWMENENQELEASQLYYDQIDRVELVEQGNFLNDSLYKVYGADGAEWEWIALYLSVEKGGNERFVEELRSRLR